MFIHGKHTIACTPSETVKDLMEVNGMSKEKFARSMDMSTEEANKFLDDYVPIDDAMAVRLHEIFGPAATFWKNLEKNFIEDRKKIEIES